MMAERGKQAGDAAKRPWFVYQLTEAESNTLAKVTELFVAETLPFRRIENRVRKLAKSCGFDQYILIGLDGHMFYGCFKKGYEEPPRNRALLTKWAAEDRARTSTGPDGPPRQ